jgi:tetratricopeptide (TPR) repeat protein
VPNRLTTKATLMRDQIEKCIRLALSGQNDTALAEIVTLIGACSPGDRDSLAYAHFARGNILVRMGRHNEGLASLREAATFDHNQPSILYNLGLEEMTVGNRQRGLEYLERAAQLGHEQAPQALAALTTGETIAVEGGGGGKLPDIILGHIQRGIANVGEGRYHDALVEYNRAIELAPDVGHTYSLRGVVYENLQQYDRALADHNQAIDRDPDNAVAHYNRGVAQERLGNVTAALDDYSRAIALDPTDADPHYNRGNLLGAAGRQEQAIADFTEAIRINPQYALAYNNRGNAHGRLGQHAEALGDYTRALELQPNESLFHLNKGGCHFNLGEISECIYHLLTALRLGDRRAEDFLRQITGRDLDFDDLLSQME